MTDRIVARVASDGEAKLVRSLLETYGIPSTLSYDMPVVYPLTVGEIRVAVPEGMVDEALRILAAHRNAPQSPVAGADVHAAGTNGAGLPARESFLVLLPDDDEEVVEEDDDDDEWDDDEDDDDDEGVEVDDGGEDDLGDDDDDDALDDEE